MMERVIAATIEIPTALVCSGTNSLDHEKFIETLGKEMAKKHHVAILHSANCFNMSSTITGLVEQFLGKEFIPDEEDEEDEAKITLFKSKKSSKVLNCDISAIRDWYSRIKEKNNRSLVVMFQDFESFNSDILNDLVLIFSDSMDKLPIVFVFGLRTSLVSINNKLDATILSRLNVEQFYLESSTISLQKVVESVFINRLSGVEFSHDVFCGLIDDYLLNSNSIKSFFGDLKFLLLEYYYSTWFGSLVDELGLDIFDEKAIKETDNKIEKNSGVLTPPQLQFLRMLPSFKSYLEKLINDSRKEKDSKFLQDCKKLLSDDEYLKAQIPKFLQDLRKYQIKYKAAFKLLCIVQEYFALSTAKKSNYELYSLGLHHSLGEDQFVTNTVLLIKFLSFDTLKDLLPKCFEHLNKFGEFFPKEIMELELLIAQTRLEIIVEIPSPQKNPKRRKVEKPKVDPVAENLRANDKLLTADFSLWLGTFFQRIPGSSFDPTVERDHVYF